jgi:hypothetical protein
MRSPRCNDPAALPAACNPLRPASSSVLGQYLMNNIRKIIVPKVFDIFADKLGRKAVGGLKQPARKTADASSSASRQGCR